MQRGQPARVEGSGVQEGSSGSGPHTYLPSNIKSISFDPKTDLKSTPPSILGQPQASPPAPDVCETQSKTSRGPQTHG